jgi:hypothetical protein
MSDNPTSAAAIVPPARPAFPYMRLIYALAYAAIAWAVVHVILLLAFVQFVVLAVRGQANEELKAFSLNLVQYLWELLAFVTLVRDEQPFPMGPFPRACA